MVDAFRLRIGAHLSTLETAVAALKELSVRLHEDAGGLAREARAQRNPVHRARAERLAAQERGRAEVYGRAARELEEDVRRGTKNLDREIKARLNHNSERRGRLR